MNLRKLISEKLKEYDDEIKKLMEMDKKAITNLYSERKIEAEATGDIGGD